MTKENFIQFLMNAEKEFTKARDDYEGYDDFNQRQWIYFNNLSRTCALLARALIMTDMDEKELHYNLNKWTTAKVEGILCFSSRYGEKYDKE